MQNSKAKKNTADYFALHLRVRIISEHHFEFILSFLFNEIQKPNPVFFRM